MSIPKRPEIYIALYGGTNLKSTNIKLVGYLTRAFLDDPHVVLVSGGIYDPKRKKTSVDLAAYKAAKSYVKEKGQKIKDRFQTWLSEKPRPDIHRKEWGHPEKLKGTPGMRRFQLVEKVNALVTVEGEGQTATVLELAMALNRPALPIGFTGTNSKEFWDWDKDVFVESLGLDPSLVERLDREPNSDQEMESLAEDVVKAVLKKAGRRCLVLMDFTDKGHASFFKRIVEPAVEQAGFLVRKLDVQETAGDILDLFLKNLQECQAIIIDLTGFNLNVLYELARVHHHDRIQPLILIRKSSRTKLPFYVQRNLVKFVGKDTQQAYELIHQHLTDNRRRP